MMRRTLLLLAMIWFLASPNTAQIDPGTRFDDVVTPGAKVTLKTSLPADTEALLQLYVVGGAVVNTSAAKVANGELVYQIPSSLAPGRYFLKVTSGSATEVVPGELRVNPAGVHLDYAHPATAYRDKVTGGFDFDVIGDGFSTDPANDAVIVDGQGDIIVDRGVSAEDCRSSKRKLPCLWVENAQKMHIVGYKGEEYQGPLNLSVRVGSVTPATKQPLILARMSPTGVLIAALLIFVLLCALIYRLVSSGVDQHISDGKPLPPWSAFFLDRETNSYSLSKFQLFAFSFIFIFSYLYVFFCRWLVQWVFELPDIPSNLSTMLALSAGTTVAAAGATSARGTKGGGNMTPTFADFVSTGGLVVPERFQFFMWTVVACLGFLALLITQNPATISKFPSFPDGLLYVMGVSAAGYLGGRLVRRPGPVIKNIAVDPGSPPAGDTGAEPNPIVIIQGQNLSSNADFFIDGQKLPLLTDEQKKETAGDAKSMLEITPQQDAADPSFASQLKIRINQKVARLKLDKGDHVFRIMNPDGQFHEIRFTLSPPQIESVSPVKAGDAETAVTVKGKNFDVGATVTWTKPLGAAEDIAPEKVKRDSAEQLTVMLVPGPAGTGTVQVRTPNGFSATATVQVT
jgi:hypothetical protein